MRTYAIILSACGGIAAALGYAWLFHEDLNPRLPANAAEGFTPADLKIIECIIVFWTAACVTGRRFYKVFGAEHKANTVQRELATYTSLLSLVAGVYILGMYVPRAIWDNSFRAKDYITLALGVLSLLVGIRDWWKRRWFTPRVRRTPRNGHKD